MKKIKKKLTLNKASIARLTDDEMATVKGGSVFVSGCVTCTSEPPECKTIQSACAQTCGCQE